MIIISLGNSDKLAKSLALKLKAKYSKLLIDKFPDGTEVPKDHPFRHSYWLSFMKKRLELAKDLLKETGVIFINIDDILQVIENFQKSNSSNAHSIFNIDNSKILVSFNLQI